MANYTVTKFKVIENIGDSIFNNNMVKGGTLTIKPKTNYVVSASDFSIKTLPNDISSVEFFDTTVPGEIGNEVNIFASLKSDFVLNKNTNIKLKILGDAKLFDLDTQLISANVRLIDDKNENSFGSTSITGFDNSVTTTTKQVGINGNLDIFTTIISNNITKNVTTKLGSITVTADTGYYFVNKPYLKRLSTDNVFLKQTSVTRDVNRKATSYNFDIMFISGFNTYIKNQQPVFIEYTAELIPVDKVEITNVVIRDVILSDLGSTIPIKVYGTEGAEFDLTITKASDITNSIINDPEYAIDVFTPYGTITGINKRIPKTSLKSRLNYCEFSQDFPMNVIKETTLSSGMSNTATMNVTSNADVQVNDRVIMGQIAGGKTIKVTELNPGSVANRLTLSDNITADNGSTVKFIRTETYDINIYPKDGVALGPNISIEKPLYTIKQITNPILKFALTSSDCTNPGNVVYAGRVNANGKDLNNLSGAVSGTNAVVTNYSTKNRFKITYTLSATSGNWRAVDATLPKWSSTDSTASSWTNSVYKDVVSKYGASTVAGNGGTHVEIFNITSSGTTTSTLTLVLDILVKKFGTDDVTMTLDLDPAFETV